MTLPWIPPFSPTNAVVGVVDPGALVVTVAQKLVALTGSAGLHSAYGALPNSIKLPWLVMPEKPSAETQGGSMRPVEAVGKLGFAVPAAKPVASAAQSAFAQ